MAIKPAITKLCEWIRKYHGVYGKAEYGSNDAKSGLKVIDTIDSNEIGEVGAVNEYNLVAALLETYIYGMMGVRSVLPELGSNTLIEVPRAIQSLNVSQLTIHEKGQQYSHGVDVYIQRNTPYKDWNGLIKGILGKEASVIGGATVRTSATNECVEIKLSDDFKKFSKIAGKVLLENENLMLTTINNLEVDLDNLPDFLDKTLVEQITLAMKQISPSVESFDIRYPNGIAGAIRNYNAKYCNVIISRLAAKCDPNFSNREFVYDIYAAYIFFCDKKISVTPSPMSGSYIPGETLFNVENGEQGTFVFLGEVGGSSAQTGNMWLGWEDGDTDVVFDFHNDGIGPVQDEPLEIVTTDIFHCGNYGWYWNATTNKRIGYTLPDYNSVIINGSTGDGYALLDANIVPLPTNPTYADKLLYLLSTSLINAGYVDKNIQWGSNLVLEDSAVNNGYKYVSLYACVSNDGKWIMPIIIASNKTLADVDIDVGTYTASQDRGTATITFTGEASENGSLYIYKDSSYMPAGLAIPTNSAFTIRSGAGGWIAMTNRHQFVNNSNFYFNRSGDGGSQNNGHIWEAGTFVGCETVSIFKNIDITTYTPSVTTDPHHDDVADALYNEVYDIIDPIIFDENLVMNIINENWTIEDLSEWSNATPVNTDDEVSLIDDTKTIDDVISEQSENNATNGVIESTSTPIHIKNIAGLAYSFNYVYIIDLSNLAKMQLALFDMDWMDKLKFTSSNPLDGVLSCIGLPFALDYTPSTGDIYGNSTVFVGVFGHELLAPATEDPQYDRRISAYTPNKTVKEIKIGNFKVSKLEPLLHKNYMDFEPYTKAEIFIPFCGLIDLSMNDIIADGRYDNELCIRYYVDLVTGLATVRLNLVIPTIVDGSGNPIEHTIYETHTNVAYQIPTSGGTFASLAATMLSAVGHVASVATLASGAGAAVKAATTIGSAALDTVTSGLKQSNTRSSGVSSNIGYTDSMVPYIVLRQHNPAEFFNSETFRLNEGYITKTAGKISDYYTYTDDNGKSHSQYLEVEGFDLSNIGATKEEQEALSEILRSGFWT